MVWLGVDEVITLRLAADFCIMSRDIICLQLHKALWYIVIVQRGERERETEIIQKDCE